MLPLSMADLGRGTYHIQDNRQGRGEAPSRGAGPCGRRGDRRREQPRREPDTQVKDSRIALDRGLANRIMLA